MSTNKPIKANMTVDELKEFNRYLVLDQGLTYDVQHGEHNPHDLSEVSYEDEQALLEDTLYVIYKSHYDPENDAHTIISPPDFQLVNGDLRETGDSTNSSDPTIVKGYKLADHIQSILHAHEGNTYSWIMDEVNVFTSHYLEQFKTIWVYEVRLEVYQKHDKQISVKLVTKGFQTKTVSTVQKQIIVQKDFEGGAWVLPYDIKTLMECSYYHIYVRSTVSAQDAIQLAEDHIKVFEEEARKRKEKQEKAKANKKKDQAQKENQKSIEAAKQTIASLTPEQREEFLKLLQGG